MTSAAFPASEPSVLDAVVDNQEDWASFSRPMASASGTTGQWESHLAIAGMRCATCSITVEHALRSVPGVLDASVNGASHLARVVWNPESTRPSRWFEAVARAGYSAVPMTDVEQVQARRHAHRLMLWRWLVAGFCMMQVMMYAVPVYVAGPGEMTSEMEHLLRWASWVLTLPVLLFSCWPFFFNAWRDLRQRSIGMDVPVALGIVIAFGASSAATFEPVGPWGREVWYDSLTMFVFFLLSGRLLEQRLRDRTAGSLESLSRRMPSTVERQRADGTFERVAVRRVAVGDVLRVAPGEAFPADGVLLSGHTQVDEALLTGESRPLARGAGMAVIAGSHNLSGVVTLRAEQVGEQTRYAAIVALMREAAAGKPRLAQLADRIARPFLAGVLLASAGAAAWWWPLDPARAIGIAIAVLIVTCPCALSLATPAATLAAAGALARRGVLVRQLQALETATLIDTVVFDKTGTLTQDRMRVQSTRVREGVQPDQAMAWAAALARHSLHPLSRAIVASAPAQAGTAREVAEHAGLGLEGRVGQGAQARSLRLGSPVWTGVASDGASEAVQVHMSDVDGWLATFDMDEALRPDALVTVQGLQAQGLQVHLLSGDSQAAVDRLARQAGITVAHGGCTPQDKLERVRSLQAQGHRVAMIGDGINDAPVLALADLSVTLGQAAPLTRSRSDVVVLGDALADLLLVLGHARKTLGVVRQNLAWAAAYNAVCVPLAVVGWMPPWLAGLGMAGSSLAVVFNAARLATLPSLNTHQHETA
jgi:Cu2+-exporting ATPase